MAELLLFAWDHASQSVPKPSLRQIAELPKRYDVVAAQRDGWRWGNEELRNPWFRILVCPWVTAEDVEPMLSPLLPQLDINESPTTYWQYRGFYPHIGHRFIPAELRDWFRDDTRAVPRWVFATPGPLTMATIKTARAPIPVSLAGEP